MKIGIIGGAGNVGSCTAFNLALHGLADDLVLLDIRQNILISHTLDITAAMSGRAGFNVKVGGYEDLADAGVIIIAAGLHFTVSSPLKERMVQNILMMHDIAVNIERYCPGAIVITVTNPSDIMNYVVYLSTSLERKRVWGYNFNDTIRFRMIAARVLGVEGSVVEGIAGGYHPLAQVMFFSSLKIKGKTVNLKDDQKQQIQTELLGYLRSYDALEAGRTAGWTTAVGLARQISAIKGDRKEVQPCSAVLNGEYGYSSISLGVPGIIGIDGIHRIEEWPLPPDEKKELSRVAAMVKTSCDLARSTLGATRP
jgi:malate dehydrogenase